MMTGLDARLAELSAIRPAQVQPPDVGQQVIEAGPVTLYVLTGAPRRTAGLRLCWDGGAAAESADQAGLHALTLQTLARSACAGVSGSVAERLESMGVTLSSGATERAAYLELRGPGEYLRPALRLLAAAIQAGSLDSAAFGAARSAAVHEADRRAHDLVRQAADQFRQARSVPGGYLARKAEGSAASLTLLSLADCTALLARLAAAPLRLIIAGDQAAEAYVSDVSPLTSPAGPAEQAVEGSVLRADPPARWQSPSGQAAHSYLLWGTAVDSADPADHVALELAGHLLGGWSGSRWSMLFREQLGLTYGVRSMTRSLAFGGVTSCLSYAGMAVESTSVPQASELLLAQAADFAAEAGQAALADAVRIAAVQLLRTEAHFHDSVSKLLARGATFLLAGLPPQFAARRIDALRCVETDPTCQRLVSLLAQPTLVVLSDIAE
jgi:predicted Zn-dependent peptidase